MIISENSGIRYIDNNGGNETKGFKSINLIPHKHSNCLWLSKFLLSGDSYRKSKNLTTSEINKNKQQIEEMFQ